MIKNFIVRKMLERQMKGIPKDQQEKILKLVSDNPEFFDKIAAEVKAKTDGGMDQKLASMQVLQKYQEDLRKIYN